MGCAYWSRMLQSISQLTFDNGWVSCVRELTSHLFTGGYYHWIELRWALVSTITWMWSFLLESAVESASRVWLFFFTMFRNTTLPAIFLLRGEQQNIQILSFTHHLVIKSLDNHSDSSFKSNSTFLMTETFQRCLST